MKRILLVAAVMVTSLMSCKKEKDVTPIPSITLKVSDIVYHPNDKILVSWKTTDMPPGSYVIAELYSPLANNGRGGYIPLIPQNYIGSPDGDQTANDGQETFTLPEINPQNPDFVPYTQYGKIFEIYLTAQYQSSSSYINVYQYSQLITIVPDGCTSNTGYSRTTGTSCSVPQ
jgi:hypothetical protein